MVVEERNKIVSEEDQKFCTRFWKVMPFFYKEELIKGAYPNSENDSLETLKTFIPNVREMYKGLVTKELLELRAKWEYCIQNDIESPWDALELFKPHYFFKRDKNEAFVQFLKHKGITDEDFIQKELNNYLTETPPLFENSLNNYWQKHNPTYLNWLEELLAPLTESVIKSVKEKKSAILIAAMNEVELEKVYDACKRAYESDFENEVAFIVFHNYKNKDTVAKEVWNSVENLQDLGQNVLVINGLVPEYFFDAPAKKVLVDLFFKFFARPNLNVFLLDADVINLSKGVFKESISILKKQNRYLVSSPEFDYDQNEIWFNYPVLKLIFDVRRDLDFFAVKEEADFNYQMAYGMFTSINLNTLILIGGLKPSTYVDGFLTNEIRSYSDSISDGNDIKYFNYPLYPLSLENQFVYVNSSRERISLGEGQEAFARWSGDSDHANITTEIRSKVEKNTLYISEFSEYTEDNIVIALNKAWLFMYKFRDSDEIIITQKEINHTKRLIRVLKNYGIEIIDAKVEVINNSNYSLVNGEGDFVIRKINKIQLIN